MVMLVVYKERKEKKYASGHLATCYVSLFLLIDKRELDAHNCMLMQNQNFSYFLNVQ